MGGMAKRFFTVRPRLKVRVSVKLVTVFTSLERLCQYTFNRGTPSCRHFVLSPGRTRLNSTIPVGIECSRNNSACIVPSSVVCFIIPQAFQPVKRRHQKKKELPLEDLFLRHSSSFL